MSRDREVHRVKKPSGWLESTAGGPRHGLHIDQDGICIRGHLAYDLIQCAIGPDRERVCVSQLVERLPVPTPPGPHPLQIAAAGAPGLSGSQVLFAEITNRQGLRPE